jgi:cytochrome c5
MTNEERNSVIEECYEAARGTHLLDKVHTYQQYWRGRAQAAEDVRKLKHDACQVCHGTKGGEPGNENIVDGMVMCDYCHAEKVRRGL